MADLIVGSDHRGYKLKTEIEKHLVPIDKDIEKDITMFLDCGCYDEKHKVDNWEEFGEWFFESRLSRCSKKSGS